MSRKPNPTVIGAFVLTAIALVVVAIIVFSSGQLLTRRSRAVVFFGGNIQGLNVGAPVTLRGVQIGTVADIHLTVNLKSMEPRIAVYIEFDPRRFASVDLSGMNLAGQEPLKTAIANGLHARLGTQSFVTGQLLVDLEFSPDEPRTLVGGDPSTIEIPATQSDVEKLRNALTRLPLDQIANSALQLLNDADHLITSPEFTRLLPSLIELLGNLDSLVMSVRGDVSNTARSSRETLATARDALKEMQISLGTANQLMATDLRQTLKSMIATLQKAEKVVVDLDSLVAADSIQRYDLDQTLKNIAATTRSLRSLADELQRRPNAVIMGK